MRISVLVRHALPIEMGTGNPQHCLDELSCIAVVPGPCLHPARQHPHDPLPLRLVQTAPDQGFAFGIGCFCRDESRQIPALCFCRRCQQRVSTDQYVHRKSPDSPATLHPLCVCSITASTESRKARFPYSVAQPACSPTSVGDSHARSGNFPEAPQPLVELHVHSRPGYKRRPYASRLELPEIFRFNWKQPPSVNEKLGFCRNPGKLVKFL